jgi:hypothetical protein
LSDGRQAVQLLLVPLLLGNAQAFVLSRCLALPEGVVVTEVGFYGDDGKSTLFAGNESGNGKEGRQALSLLVEDGSEQELWLINYERMQFEVVQKSISEGAVDLRDWEPDADSALPIVPRTDGMDEAEDEDDVVYARSKCALYLVSRLLYQISHSATFSSIHSID